MDLKFDFGLLAIIFVLILGNVSCESKEDQIKHLPGLNHIINFKHYSGYLDGADGDYLHYWFVTSQLKPEKSPLILWMNGGPGCSSMDGLFNELGPYSISDDGKYLNMNEFTWNKIANIIFLESPVCVGFSYRNDTNCQASDEKTSLTNYLALQSFFKKFPEFKGNELFITGESYAGIYVPTLTERIVKGLDKVPMNIQGFAVGNGLSSIEFNDNSIIFFAYYHGLFGDDLWKKLVQECCAEEKPSKTACQFSQSSLPACEGAVNDAMKVIYNNDLNMYNMYAKCLHPKSFNGSSRYHYDRANQFQLLKHKNVLKGKAKLWNKLNLDPPCTDSTNVRIYLNNPDVIRAIHVKTNITWDICNDEVNYNYIRQYDSMKDQYLFLTKHVRGLLYNGDVDMACNFLGDEWFAESLRLEKLKDRSPWFYQDQIGGYVKRFKNLDVLTIRGAGHMVPQDKPGPALKMISALIKNKDY